MGLMGSIFGGAIGFSLGGPVGAVLGAIVGHRLGESATGAGMERVGGSRAGRMGNGAWGGRAERVADAQQQAQAVFFVTTFSMLAKMAKADGRVSPEEIEVVQEFMRIQLHLAPEDERYAEEIFRQAKNSPDSFDDFARQFAQVFSGQARMREIMLDLLVRVAAADGVIDPAEREMLGRAASIFGVEDATLRGIVDRRAKDSSRHYAILGLSPSASNDELKSRYRKLVTQYHPDKIIAKGLPQEFIELAEKRFTEIQEAYEALREQRRMH